MGTPEFFDAASTPFTSLVDVFRNQESPIPTSELASTAVRVHHPGREGLQLFELRLDPGTRAATVPLPQPGPARVAGPLPGRGPTPRPHPRARLCGVVAPPHVPPRQDADVEPPRPDRARLDRRNAVPARRRRPGLVAAATRGVPPRRRRRRRTAARRLTSATATIRRSHRRATGRRAGIADRAGGRSRATASPLRCLVPISGRRARSTTARCP